MGYYLSRVVLIISSLLISAFVSSVSADESLSLGTPGMFSVVQREMQLGRFKGDHLTTTLNNFPGYVIDVYYVNHKPTEGSELSSTAEAAVISVFNECQKGSKHDSLVTEGQLILAFQKRCKSEKANSKDKHLRWVVFGAFKGEATEYLFLYSWVMPDTDKHGNVGSKMKDEIFDSLKSARLCGGAASPSCDEVLKQRLYPIIYEDLRR